MKFIHVPGYCAFLEKIVFPVQATTTYVEMELQLHPLSNLVTTTWR